MPYVSTAVRTFGNGRSPHGPDSLHNFSSREPRTRTSARSGSRQAGNVAQLRPQRHAPAAPCDQFGTIRNPRGHCPCTIPADPRKRHHARQLPSVISIRQQPARTATRPPPLTPHPSNDHTPAKCGNYFAGHPELPAWRPVHIAGTASHAPGVPEIKVFKDEAQVPPTSS